MNAVYETPQCVNSSTSQEQIRAIGALGISPTARYVAQTMLVTGKTSASDLHDLTGLPERTIYRAKREYAAATNGSTATSDMSPVAETLPPVAVKGPRVRARIDSPFGRDSFSEEVKTTTVGEIGEVAAADAAPPRLAKAGRYAFEGRVVRLTQPDLDRWRKAYPAIPDLTAALTAADDYYAEHLQPGEKWFHRASRWLANENTKAAQATKPPPWREAEERKRAEVRQLLGLEAAQ